MLLLLYHVIYLLMQMFAFLSFSFPGESLSLLVLRSAPGLGNVSVDWTIQGPLTHRTFTQTSGTLFFTKVKYGLLISSFFNHSCTLGRCIVVILSVAKDLSYKV